MAVDPNPANDDKDKKNKINCIGCNSVLQKDHTGIVCVGEHHICPDECAQNFVINVFDEPAKQIPLKCMMCKADIIVQTFERQLTVKQTQTFLLYNLKYDSSQFLDNNEIIASCPFCDYFEINTVDTGRLLFLCQGSGCKKSSCFWCKKLIKNKPNTDDQKVDMDQTEVEKHFICSRLAPYKQKWDKALADGNVKPCPKCGISGMKNNACTHMTCVQCQQQWCYVCGIELEKLDKDPNYNNIFSHNVNWKTNPKRCPMWLNNICEIDNRWPVDNSDGCVTFLHRLRTMSLLKKVITEIGNDKYLELCQKYNINVTCGFDINDILNGDHTIIKR